MDSPAPFTMKLPLDRVTALAMDPGAHVVLSGQVMASMDGTSFDAASLFDFAAGGLRIVEADPAHFAYVLAPTGQYAPACARVAGAACLVPRLGVLAHQRLHTAAELASTLSGSIELESHPPPSAAPAIAWGVALAVAGLGAIVALVRAAVWLSRRAARTAMGRIRVAARRALRGTRGDVTLDAARTQIRALVDRARQLDALRRACRVGSDHDSAVVELERIESVLRTAAVRVGRPGGVAGDRARLLLRSGQATLADPIDALVTELDLRDAAIAEADAT
jgi:hypothetical protein